MKRFVNRVLIVLFFLGCSISTYSQILTTKKGAPLYPVASMRVKDNYIKPGIASMELGNNKKLNYIGCTHTKEVFYYDAYVVSYKGETYVVPSDFIVEEEILKSENEKLDLLKKDFEGKVQLYTEQYKEAKENFLKEQHHREKVIRQKIDSVDAIMKQIEKVAEPKADSLDEISIKEAKSLFNKLSPNVKSLTDKILISESSLSEPNSAGGCDYTLVYMNRSSKTIKYLNWKGVIYNRVGDKVSCSIRDTYTFSGKDTGPYSPDEPFCGGTWDCVIYNWSAYKMELTSIGIIYMDGTSFNVSLQKGEYDKLLDYYSNGMVNQTKSIIHPIHLKEICSTLGYEKYEKEKSNLYGKLSVEQERSTDSIVIEADKNLSKIKDNYKKFIQTGDKNLIN